MAYDYFNTLGSSINPLGYGTQTTRRDEPHPYAININQPSTGEQNIVGPGTVPATTREGGRSDTTRTNTAINNPYNYGAAPSIAPPPPAPVPTPAPYQPPQTQPSNNIQYLNPGPTTPVNHWGEGGPPPGHILPLSAFAPNNVEAVGNASTGFYDALNKGDWNAAQSSLLDWNTLRTNTGQQAYIPEKNSYDFALQAYSKGLGPHPDTGVRMGDYALANTGNPVVQQSAPTTYTPPVPTYQPPPQTPAPAAPQQFNPFDFTEAIKKLYGSDPLSVLLGAGMNNQNVNALNSAGGMNSIIKLINALRAMQGGTSPVLSPLFWGAGNTNQSNYYPTFV